MTFEQFYVGQTFVTDKHRVTQEEMLEFAVKYDPQTIHLNQQVAAEGMYGNIIASGFLTLSVAWTLFIRAHIFGEESRAGAGMDKVRFLAPVFPGDSLYTIITILELRPSKSRPELGIVTFSFAVKNQHDLEVLTCQIVGLIMREDHVNLDEVTSSKD
ncbi:MULTISPECIES: MaoC/PaaZ C-terminal domain-containing protein [unclassified Paenibacillus]|uniref:MaoC/PaaZ C-terminal domain-containing protein n=1 Tax=unclassified Paenibacillus TaxID=185978 RepID=UPI001AE1910C|nr:MULTISPECIES: MaoC/PaaZ C-terminal domain-containing protein [unclassified Paenibacillus]MBP1154029.1 acyl dehydratase [Paenibacillus sp. PvP091]MBP1170586.1 acyl dehydratase [Paenibacillus sp. PvR098]MBP2441614.1 acyl dehydratase [Paenibacillus sp. PvP052]